MTDGNGNEARTAIYNTPVSYLSGFSAQFIYKATPGASGTNMADGMAFMLENSTNPTTVLGGGGGGLGYSGITPSAAITDSVYNGGAAAANLQVGVSQNGNVAFQNTFTGEAANLAAGNPLQINVSYSTAAGGTITETLTDTVTNATQTYTTTGVSLSSILGGNGTAYFAFGGGTGGAESVQQISNFSITYAGVNNIADYSANNVTLTGSATATIDVSIAASLPTASMGTLTVGNGSNTTLNVTATSARPVSPTV